jgi:hypothetical protein
VTRRSYDRAAFASSGGRTIALSPASDRAAVAIRLEADARRTGSR